MFAAVCPDLAQAYYFLYLDHYKKIKPKFDPLTSFHQRLQWNATPQGLIVEIVWVIAGLGIILSQR